MVEEFTPFPRLPPELRQQVWRTALTQAWSITSFKRAGRSVRCVGHVHLAVAEACCEARQVMKTTHTKVEARWSTRWREGKMFLGWVNFDRHLFIVRDIEYDLGLLKELFKHGIMSHVQHLVVNAQDYWLQFETIKAVKLQCPSLRNIVVVAPWLDRTLVDIPQDIMPYEDWGPLTRRSPKEIDWSPILNAVDKGEPNNIYRHAWDQAKIERLLQEFPNGPPRFYMRRRDDIRHPEVCSSDEISTASAMPSRRW